MLALGSRQVESLLRNGQENTINTVPQFATYLEQIRMSPERRQSPDHERSTKVAERKFDDVSGKYTGEAGLHYQVDSYMPVPYDFILKCYLVTSNLDQKCQLMEQIMIIFNPAIDFQTSNNHLDWTSLGIVELTDIQWSSNSFPATEENLDIAEMTFNMRAWITPPAKVKKQEVVEEIIANIGTISDMEEKWQNNGAYFTPIATLDQTVVTPGDLAIEVSLSPIKNRMVVTLKTEGSEDPNGNEYDWVTLLARYGEYDGKKSKLTLIDEYDGLDTQKIRCTGTFEISSDRKKLYWDIEANSLPPLSSAIPNVIDIIDPMKTYPGIDGFKKPEVGDRYVVFGKISPDSKPWQPFSLNGLEPTGNGDIVEFDGTGWKLVFSANSEIPVWSYCISTNDYISFTKINDGYTWHSTLAGRYNPGNWRLTL